MLNHPRRNALILTIIFLSSILSLMASFLVGLETLESSLQTDSGEIKQIAIKPDSHGNAKVEITFPFNAYAFEWSSDSEFLYSWDGNMFAEVETDPDTNGEAGKFSEMRFDNPGTGALHIKKAKSDINLILFNTATPTGQVSAQVLGAETVDLENGRVVNRASGMDISALNIVPRSEWGADESLMNWTPEYWPVDKIVIHHTVMTSGSNYAGAVRAIFLFHTITRGWGDIGYNYIIDPNGTIYEGRVGGAQAIAAHAYSHNAGSIGISLIGNFENSSPTKAARDSLKRLLVERALVHGLEIKIDQTLFGHRDMSGSNTSCPGHDLYERLPNIAAEVEAARLAEIATNPIAVTRASSQQALQGYQDVRLKLTFKNPAANIDEARAKLPAHSAIESILELDVNGATIETRDFSNYYGPWVDHTLDRVKFLHQLFSLDPQIASVELLTDSIIVSSKPSNNGFYLARKDLYLDFSREMGKGSGFLEFRDFSSDTVVEQIDVTSSRVTKVAARRYRINLTDIPEVDNRYYLTVCDGCFIDPAGVALTGADQKTDLAFRVNQPHRGQSDFDGDGVGDLVLITKANELKIDYSKGGYSGWNVTLQPYGGDKVTAYPADYDGDDKLDFAVRSAAGQWRIDYAADGFEAWDFARTGYGDSTTKAVPADYDGDGKTDISIRNSQDRWLIDYAADGFDGWDVNSPNRGPASSRLVPSDYDGDGKIDMSVRELSGRWKIDYAENGFNGWDKQVVNMGDSGAAVLPYDFDGDKKTDLSYRTGNGTWVIDYAGNGFGSKDVVRTKYGGALARALPADYDGDGSVDLAVRSLGGNWKIDYKADGFRGWNFNRNGYGTAADSPILADYDADGRIDLAVRTPVGKWRIDGSATSGFRGFDLTYTDRAGTGVRPSARDYDGDGRADVSLTHPDGYWMLDNSANGISQFDLILGGYGKLMVNSDFDGDAKTDIAARTVGGVWLIDFSANALGSWDSHRDGYGSGGVNTPADYDGDGIDDLATFASGSWNIDYSANGFNGWDVQREGLGEYQLGVSGDFDGDGKFDMAVKNDSGTVLIDLAANGFGSADQTLTGRGNNTTKFSAMDYDGDRSFDLASLDSLGTWRVDYSKNGLGAWDATHKGYGKNVTVFTGDFDGDSVADLSVKDANRWLIDASANKFGLWDLGYWLDL